MNHLLINKVFIIFLFLIFLLFLSCNLSQTQNKSDDKSITITSLGWYIENIDSSFWTSSTPPSHCFYDFFIHYIGDISLNDISYAKIYEPSGYYWSLPLTSTYFNIQTKTIGGWYRCYSSSTPNILEIGNVRVEVKLTDGNISSLNKTIPAPGNLTTNNYSYVYSADSPSSSYTPMVYRANSLSGTKTTVSSTITINFKVNDANVYNGYIWFYDSSNNYIGVSKTFRDTTNGNVNSIINSSNININNTNNIVTLLNSDITFQTGNISSITRFIVVLTDGSQYVAQGKYAAYDCRSISGRIDLTIN